MKHDDNRPTALRSMDSISADNQGELRLLVMVGEDVQSHRLPNEGRVVIGRGAEADIQVSDSTISRRHAVLTLGPHLFIADLGSLNGTRVRGRKLAPKERLEFSLGEVIEIGDTMVVLQPKPIHHTLLEFLDQRQFEAQVKEEFSWAQRQRKALAMVHVQIDPTVPKDDFESTLSVCFRKSDGAVGRDGSSYHLLLPNATPAMAETLCHRLAKSLGAIQAQVRFGITCYPRDAQVAEDLLLKPKAKKSDKPLPSEDADRWVFKDEAMQGLRRMIERIATSNTSIIIQGETGVGKEVIARMIHLHSHRPSDMFLSINCAALPDNLLESELFGYERGAFTGALKAKPGLLEAARDGTFLLDEVSEMPLMLQVKLLRVLEEKTAVRIGGLKPYRIDARFIATANRNIEEAVRQGTFRQDLFYRLNGITLFVPPLRERPVDIEPLARMFMGAIHQQLNRPGEPDLTDEALGWLLSYRWPGNVRELRNLIERAVVLSPDGRIDKELVASGNLPQAVTRSPDGGVPPAGGKEPDRQSLLAPTRTTHLTPGPRFTGEPTQTNMASHDTLPAKSLKNEVEDIEYQRILEALEKTGGNQTEAAKLLGIARRTLINRLERYNIKRPRKVTLEQ